MPYIFNVYMFRPSFHDWVDWSRAQKPAPARTKTLRNSRPSHNSKPLRRSTTAKSKWRKG